MIRLHNLKLAAMIVCLFAFASCGDNKDPQDPSGETVAVTGVTLDKPAIVLAPGQTATLAADITPSNATDKTVTWTSSDPAVASIDSKGEVLAHKLGSTTITVTTTDGGHEASCGVEVAISVTGVSLNKTALSLAEGGSETLVATVTPEEAINKEVIWTSSDKTVATVVDGTVKALSEGNATITVKTVDGGFEDHCEVTVTVENITHPFGDIYFRTADIKTIGSQTWSDVVIATRCLKNDFDGGSLENGYKVDCRQNPGYGHMFSWEAVNQFGESLCPANQGWRVPSLEDFIALDEELTGYPGGGVRQFPADRDLFINEWGATYGGYAHGENMYSTGSWGRYWSGTGHGALPAVGHALYVKKDGEVNSIDYGDKMYGLMLRCVK